MIIQHREHSDFMVDSFLLDKIKIIYGPEKSLRKDSVLIVNRSIKAFGQDARNTAKKMNIQTITDDELVFAPCLVDPHSVLEDPVRGKLETLTTLSQRAARAGYGQIALLPKDRIWRDSPEQIQALKKTDVDNVLIHLWGGFSQAGKGERLSSHKELIDHGAIGLADSESMIPYELLKKGLVLNEIQHWPILIAPRDESIKGNGLVRESVEALRSGLHQDPIYSETIPLAILLELQKQHPSSGIRLMNMSTTSGVLMLTECIQRPMSTVCWWHLVADQSVLTSSSIGMIVTPSLGSPEDRKTLIEGLLSKTITGVSVHSTPLDDNETMKAPSQRTPGLSSYQLVLPTLWQELVKKNKCSIEQLWDAISFGPSKILNLPPEELTIGSKRWVLFDPNKKWTQTAKAKHKGWTRIANQPLEGIEITGRIIDAGLIQ